MRAVHPGEILREDFIAPSGISVNAPAKALNVPATRIHELSKNGVRFRLTRRKDWLVILEEMPHHG